MSPTGLRYFIGDGLFLGRLLILLDYLSKEEVLGANSLLGATNTSGLRSVVNEATKGFYPWEAEWLIRNSDEQFIASSPTGFKWDCALVGVQDDHEKL